MALDAQSDFKVSEILNALKSIDTTAERVESISQLFQRHYSHAETITGFWIDEIRRVEPSDRMPFLYIANDVIQKTRDLDHSFLPHFSTYIEEAVSLVCNHPEDRERVVRLLQVWSDRNIFCRQVIRRLHLLTGDQSDLLVERMDDSKDEEVESEPQPLTSSDAQHFSVNPVIDTLKQMDKNDAIVNHLRQKLMEIDCASLLIEGRFATPEKVIAEGSTADIRQRVEQCIALTKKLKKYVQRGKQLSEKLHSVSKTMITKEAPANDKVDVQFQQCDEIDISLQDLKEHKTSFAEKWEEEESLCRKRKLEYEEAHSKRTESIKLELEVVSSASPRVAKQTVADVPPAHSEARKDDRQLVWHPVLKELVRVPSTNADEEDWRDR